MCDIFLSQDLRTLFEHKKVVFIGDSNVRALYKDVLCLYTKSQMISAQVLKDKMEHSVFSDKLVFHKERTNGRDYKEERALTTKRHNFSFYFITRVYNEYTEEVLKKITFDREPDVVIMNSCMWDMCRWGPTGVEEYKKNFVILMKRLKEVLNENCLLIWLTAPPIAAEPYGGFLVVQLEFFKYCLRFHVMEANHFARKVVVAHGFDVLDVHYHLRMQVQRRCKDGIHWDSETMRYINNLLLTHISLAWDVPLPHRNVSIITSRAAVEDNNESFALESEIDTPAKQAPAQERNKKWKRSTHHEYVKKARMNLAKRNIQKWSPIRAPPRSPMQYSEPLAPFQWMPRESGEPFRFSASRHNAYAELPQHRRYINTNFHHNMPFTPERNHHFVGHQNNYFLLDTPPTNCFPHF